MKALDIVNTAKNTPTNKELGLQRISLEDYKTDDNTSIQHSEETENKFAGPPKIGEEFEFDDEQVDNLDHSSIGSVHPFQLSLESNITSSDNGVDKADTIPDDPDDNNSSSSNKLEKLLDDLSTDMEQDFDPSVPPSPHSPFRKKRETKN